MQKLLVGAAIGGGGAPTCILEPQFVQKAFATGTSAWHAEHVRVSGCDGAVATFVCELSAEPQCMQKDAPGLTSSLQRGQTFIAGLAVAWTGVPHCWQNFLPVTSLPHDAQVAMMLGPPRYLCVYFCLNINNNLNAV